MEWSVAGAILAALLTVVATELAVRQRRRRDQIEEAVLTMTPLVSQMRGNPDVEHHVGQLIVRIRVLSRRMWGRRWRRINLEAQDLQARHLAIVLMSLNPDLDLSNWYRNVNTWALSEELFGGRDLTDELAHWYGDNGVGPEKPPLYREQLTYRGRLKRWVKQLLPWQRD